MRTWKKLTANTLVESTIIEVRRTCTVHWDHVQTSDYRRPAFERMQSSEYFDRPCWLCGADTVTTWGPAHITYASTEYIPD